MGKFGVLICEDSPRWNSLYDCYVKDFGREGDTWTRFDVYKGQLPTANDMHEYQAFLISGSHNSCYEHLPWLTRFKEFLRDYHRMAQQERMPKMVGICFGHQLLACALGGTTVHQQGCKIDVGATDIHLKHQFFEQPFVQQAKDHPQYEEICRTKTIRALESHGDVVTRVPPGGVVLASSSTTPIQMFVLNDTFLGIQMHADFEKHHLVRLIIPVLRASHSMSEDQIQAAKQSLDAPIHNDFLRTAVRNFIAPPATATTATTAAAE